MIKAASREFWDKQVMLVTEQVCVGGRGWGEDMKHNGGLDGSD